MSAGFALVMVSALAAPAAVEERPVAEQYLLAGDLAGGDAFLTRHLAGNPGDAQARFGLGAIRFVRAVEHLMQSFHRFGVKPDAFGGQVPFFRLPIAPNPNPQPIAYEDLRKVFEDFASDMAQAESTLAGVEDDDVKLRLRLGQIRLDFDGDGKATADETLWKILARYNAQLRQSGVDPQAAEAFEVAFDRGDVAWMRGYSHLLMAFAEVYLAHDGKALFDHTAHLVFARPRTPFPFLKDAPPAAGGPPIALFSDVIAFVHLLNLPVREPKRMASALGHLESMVRLSRESWKAYLAETDDDREWIPNPKQDTVVPGGRVTDEMVKEWTLFLDEADQLLSGKMLVPFWRDAGGKGINLRRVFTEPTPMDLVLWAQGTAATPYLEGGPVTQAATWARLQRVFRGEFLGFALWFN